MQASKAASKIGICPKLLFHNKSIQVFNYIKGKTFKSEDIKKKAIEMLLSGATLVSEPCPYCKGVRVMKDGNALCVSCGKGPDTKIEVKDQESKKNYYTN